MGFAALSANLLAAQPDILPIAVNQRHAAAQRDQHQYGSANQYLKSDGYDLMPLSRNEPAAPRWIPMPQASPHPACYLSRGIGRIAVLPALLPEYTRLEYRLFPGNGSAAILGWGRKPTSARARRLADRRGIPYIALEDGFLRSWGLGVSGYQPHSLVVDCSGVYYDASRPSDLERFIQQADFTPAELTRARQAMAALRHHRLSKYNHAPDRWVPSPPDRRRVLVVDQTWGDASVVHGGATAATFKAMLDAAIAENPNAEVVVKVHPDVIAGKKRGYLLDHALQKGCAILADDINPWAIFDGVDQVYVVTSQMGFEALFAGLSVTCFGQPFYAGWGLTDDRQPIARRGLPRALEQVFAAAYLHYCRYANPYTGQACQLEDTLELIADQKRQHQRLQGRWVCAGFSGWKRRFVGRFLGAGATARFYSDVQQIPDRTGDARMLVWASQINAQVLSVAHARDIPLWRMEDGFIRSVGLGVDLERPLSLVIDSRGIYYDASQPSDLEHILNTHPFPEPLLERAGRVRERLVKLGLSKYNVGSDRHDLTLPTGRRLVLVPGQVETDASIALGSPQIKTNRGLLEAVRAQHPDAFVIYKPHPDVVSGGRIGELAPECAHLYDRLVTDIAMPTLLQQVDEVHTLCSLTGFEALLRGVKVFTYGLPFYAGWGLTQDLLQCERRGRQLGLDQLVAATLILYPTYVEPDTGQLCDVETVIELIAQRRERVSGPPLKATLYRWYRRLFEGRQ